MMRIVTILCLVILASCTSQPYNKDYSLEFQDHFSNGTAQLRKDSLLLPMGDTVEVVLIPTLLILNREYVFADQSGQSIRVKRKNYTDVEFHIIRGEHQATGVASISPSFYLGMETVATKGGEFVINEYFVQGNSGDCLWSIGVGNQNIEEGGSMKLYAYIKLVDNCNENKFTASTDLLIAE